MKSLRQRLFPLVVACGVAASLSNCTAVETGNPPEKKGTPSSFTITWGTGDSVGTPPDPPDPESRISIDSLEFIDCEGETLLLSEVSASGVLEDEFAFEALTPEDEFCTIVVRAGRLAPPEEASTPDPIALLLQRENFVGGEAAGDLVTVAIPAPFIWIVTANREPFTTETDFDFELNKFSVGLGGDVAPGVTYADNATHPELIERLKTSLQGALDLTATEEFAPALGSSRPPSGENFSAFCWESCKNESRSPCASECDESSCAKQSATNIACLEEATQLEWCRAGALAEDFSCDTSPASVGLCAEQSAHLATCLESL